MKKTAKLLVLSLISALILTGCGCSHEWAEADCLVPKTCINCQETEGEALGHSWVDATCAAPKTCGSCGLTEGDTLEHTWEDATCAAPKTCGSCGLTEGEALEHTWVEANYQVPQTCSVCNAAEGDPLPADFEELGLAIDVEQVNVEYPLVLGGKDCVYTIDDYRVYASDEKHPARDGFEWRTVTYTVKCLKGTLPRELPTYGDYNNYYDIEHFNSSVSQVNTDWLYAMKFAVNYYGVDYPDCHFQMEKSNVECVDNSWSLTETLSFQVPEGFDGIFLCMGDKKWITRDYYQQYMDLYNDENSLFFRLK